MTKKLTVKLYDVDGRIPNVALMKLSTYYRAQGCAVDLDRVRGSKLPADCGEGICTLPASSFTEINQPADEPPEAAAGSTPWKLADQEPA